MAKPKIIVICGPTATGKSDLAVELAGPINGEVISADSRQIYTYLNLGTGKITPLEMKKIPHHMLDVVTPDEKYTVDQFKKESVKVIQRILEKNNIPILCGGTGLYIDAIINDTEFPDVSADLDLREELETKSTDELVSIFHQLNNNQPHKVDLKNKRKIIRAIEILKSLGHIPSLEKKDLYDVLYIGLDGSDEVLKEKIKRRIEKRIQDGMLEESEHLLSLGLLTHERMQELGLEYKFISDLLRKEITLDELKEKLFFAIWHYAKRQRTWFKRNKEIHWLDISDDVNGKALSLVDEFLK